MPRYHNVDCRIRDNYCHLYDCVDTCKLRVGSTHETMHIKPFFKHMLSSAFRIVKIHTVLSVMHFKRFLDIPHPGPRIKVIHFNASWHQQLVHLQNIVGFK